jgi:hypothetical protein
MIAAIVLGSLGSMTFPTGSDGVTIPSVTQVACAHYVSVIPERVESAYDLGSFIYDCASPKFNPGAKRVWLAKIPSGRKTGLMNELRFRFCSDCRLEKG